jgi:hypothetical protein
VAVGDGGLIAVAWADQRRLDVFFQVYDREGEAQLDAPVNVSRSPEIFSWLPRLALVAGDPSLVYVAWQELIFSGGTHGGDLFFARSTDGGKRFDAPLNLSGSIAGDGKGRVSPHIWDNGSLDVVVGPTGEIHVAWTEYEGALWYRRSTDGGATFSGRERIAGDAKAPARAPSLAVDADRAVHLAWTVREGGTPGIRVATSADGGAFGAPAIVGKRDGSADAPRMAVDRGGTVHLVYAEMALTSAESSHIRYTRRLEGHDTFEPPRRISGTDAGSTGFPSLDVDGDGSLYVVWERFSVGRLGLGFARSRDTGGTFSPPSIVPGTAEVWLGVNGSLQGALMSKLAVAEDGTIAVVNSSFQKGSVSRVRLILGMFTS